MSDLNIFFSYSALDTDYFKIPELAERLENFPEINEVFFWEGDSGEDIVEYMERVLQLSKVFILFCSEHSLKSKSVEKEWYSALYLRNLGLSRIIPIYENEDYIPQIFRSLLSVKYTKDDFDEFITNLYNEISRRTKEISPKETYDLDLDEFNENISRISQIYKEITLEKLSKKTKIKIEDLEDLLEKMIITNKIKAFISRDSIVFERGIIGSSQKEKLDLKEKLDSITRYFKVFISYATPDSEFFQIPEIVEKLEDKKRIEKALYWERDGGGNIIDYMNDNLPLCDVFVMFCSKNAKESISVKREWQAAYQLCNDGVLNIIPVFEEKEYVPVLLRSWLYVEFMRDNINGFVDGLHQEILR